jgi:hypothetical protein
MSVPLRIWFGRLGLGALAPRRLRWMLSRFVNKSFMQSAYPAAAGSPSELTRTVLRSRVGSSLRMPVFDPGFN